MDNHPALLNIQLTSFILPAFECTAKYTKIRAGRQTGKTYWGVQWMCINMLAMPNARWLWVDTVQLNIGKYIERYFKPILGVLWDTVVWDRQKNIITFQNGSVLDFWSAERPENLEWFGYDFVLLNEAGIILKKEGLWEKTIQPMCKTAQVKIIGTPKGKTGHKYAEMSDWCKYDDEWEEFHYSCYDSPYWSPWALDKIKEQVPSYVWQQEYLAEHVDLYENSMLSIENLAYYNREEMDFSQFTKVYMHADTTHTGNATSDYFACGVIWEGKDKNFYLLDYVLEKMDEETQARASIVLYQKWQSKVQKFTYDEKANQGFGFWIRKLAKEEYGVSLPIEELRYSKDKITHFSAHVPHFKARRVYLPSDHTRTNILQDQLLAFPERWVNDDGVDLLSSLLDNYHTGDWLYFAETTVAMQPITPPMRELNGWKYYEKREEHRYAMGCRITEHASIIVINMKTKHVVAEYYAEDVVPQSIADQLSEKGKFFNNAIISVSNDKIGSSVLQSLKEKSYPNIAQNTNQTGYDDKDTERLGINLTPTSKWIIINQLGFGLKTFALLVNSYILKEDILRYPRENAEQLDDSYIRIVALAIAYDLVKKTGTNKITIS